jgi:hypothetical protein
MCATSDSSRNAGNQYSAARVPFLAAAGSLRLVVPSAHGCTSLTTFGYALRGSLRSTTEPQSIQQNHQSRRYHRCARRVRYVYALIGQKLNDPMGEREHKPPGHGAATFTSTRDYCNWWACRRLHAPQQHAARSAASVRTVVTASASSCAPGRSGATSCQRVRSPSSAFSWRLSRAGRRRF